MQTYVSCSWCHGSNPAGALSCRYCGHNANRSRMECSCPSCMGTEPPEEALPLCVVCGQPFAYQDHHVSCPQSVEWRKR